MEKESSELSWARDQHTRISAQVRAGNCANAASIAVTLSNRAPAYYQQNVENDRDLKQCVAYIATEREKDAELRAKQRARANQRRSADEPAKAAPSTTAK
jgi:hypothetical protein